jgi:hypothetical protein
VPASLKEGQGALRAIEGTEQGAGRETKRNRRDRQSILMNIPWRSAPITMHPRKSVKFLKIWRSLEAYSRLAEVYPPNCNLPAIARWSEMGYCFLWTELRHLICGETAPALWQEADPLRQVRAVRPELLTPVDIRCRPATARHLPRPLPFLLGSFFFIIRINDRVWLYSTLLSVELHRAAY